MPFFQRPGGHDVGMSGKGQQRLAAAATRPQVGDVAENHGFTIESHRLEALDQDRLAARVFGRYRWF